jgi:hypothetical protein
MLFEFFKIMYSSLHSVSASAIISLAILCAIGTITPAHSATLIETGPIAAAASAIYYDICKNETDLGRFTCGALAIAFDPVSPKLKPIGLDLSYDSTKFIFNESRSGPLDNYGVGGISLGTNAQIGSVPVSILDENMADSFAGDLLPGSSVTYNNSPGNVSFTLSYDNGLDPGPGNNNFFLLYFDAINRFDPVMTATYSSPDSSITPPSDSICTVTAPVGGVTAGGATFTQSNFRCTPVPGPLPVLGVGAFFGYVRKLRRAQRD